MFKRIMLATTVAIGLGAAPAIAQNQDGLVNVNVSQVDISRVISDNNINVQAPIGAIVQVPIGIAANVCDISANVLAAQAKNGGAACDATTESATDAELATLARSIQRR